MGSLGLATRLVILECGICQERVAFPAGPLRDPEDNEGTGQSGQEGPGKEEQDVFYLAESPHLAWTGNQCDG